MKGRKYMDIVKALTAAQAAGEPCIRRTLGIMKSRILKPTDTKYGCLMCEQLGVAESPTPVQANYSLTAEDLLSIQWNVAEGKDLSFIPDSAEGFYPDTQPKATIDDAISGLCSHIIEEDLSNETVEVLTKGIGTLAQAKYDSFRGETSMKKGGKIDDSQ